MQIPTIISLAGTLVCAGLFVKQRNWVLAAAFMFATAYTVMNQVMRIPGVPPVAVMACAWLFFALLAVETLRKVVLK
jgi:hypothetical protein